MQLSSTLKLRIVDFPNLISIPDLQYLHSLFSLEIAFCKRSMGLPEGLDRLTCLKTLKLRIVDFPNLISIPDLQYLHSLFSLEIAFCK